MDIFTGQGKRYRANANDMDYHPQGLPGSTRVVLNHLDVSTQANIQHSALNYESEDEMMSRMSRDRKGTPHYNREDIREQYCITERGLGALETKQSLFGCLSSHQGSCSNRTSLLTACVRQKVPSDENLYDLYRRHPSEYAPYPRRSRYPWGPVVSDIYRYDEDLKSSYFRRKPIIDPSRYTWMPSDDESVRMEKPRSIIENCHDRVTNSSSVMLPGKKHVSFARSHTLASFDNALSTLSYSTGHLNQIATSQERLLDVRKPELTPIITKQPEQEVFCDKIKRVPMKTQATQTEVGLGRKPLPPHINLSPRTIQKVKMVSQGAQTNGIATNGRKLIKSYSEAGSKFGISPMNGEVIPFDTIPDHEPLQRTQSDEPPRSPFIVDKAPTFSLPDRNGAGADSETSSLTKSDEHESEDSNESKKEIFIDFKPQLSPSSKMSKRTLMKALSDGEILLEQRRVKISDDCVVPEKPVHSVSHEDVHNDDDERIFTPYFQKMPIQNEGVCKPLEENVYSSLDNGMYAQDSIDEDFHEHLIYSRTYLDTHEFNGEQHINMENWLKDDSIVPSISFLPHAKLSPFTSNDSLANETRDQSDGIWNESQATVLQVDSGTDNGTILSSSEFNSATSPVSTSIALTPSSKRKHMLMIQHQQRSSMDTENLDEETVDQNLTYLRKVSPAKTVESPATVFPPRQYLSVENILPIRKKFTPETPVGSPLPAVVPDLLLSRTDSCRTNTDVSESTTTDDYITANSGTDSSRKSGSIKGPEFYNNLQQAHITDGSSLESARGLDAISDDMVVPSFSPPPPCTSASTTVGDSSHSLCNTPVPNIRTGRSTPSEDSSSSCGSYSVGSTPDLLDRFTETVPSRNKKVCPPNVSDDERSVRYSSSGYYESPMEDDTTWTSPKNNHHRRCKDFTLDLSNNPNKSYLETYSILNTKPNKRNIKASPSAEKPKRSKPRMRSPMQGSRKNSQLKKQAHIQEKENKATSDESSCDIAVKHLSNQNSPRRGKKTKENSKKKGIPRSPVSQRNAQEKKSSSLPGSLSRKKSSKQSHNLAPESGSCERKNSVSSPLSLTRQSPKKVEDSTKLKALSAESLRSVSPGSDSVFYSDPSSQTADHQVHCLHCGKEVDIVTTDDPDKSISSLENPEEIVQPPAGFEDSPRVKTSGRLFKKLERRIRSEERNYLENKKNRYKSEVRAKSEERGASTYKSKLRPMAKSTTSSQEQLKATDSSPSVLPGAPENEDDTGIYDVPYMEGCWIHIDERDEVIARTSCSSPSDKPSSRKDSISSTESEQEFRKKFQAVTHRMVHRKSCLEMYKRQNNKSFDCDKTVIVRRESGEFGFRIHGSKPVVVSAIEPGTPAETSGLEVGDIVLSVNGVSVLDKNHSEIVKIAHAGSDTLKMEVARTCYALSPQQEEEPSKILFSGYLWKLSGYASGNSSNRWMRRWFCLKQNGCLYCYKTDMDKHPVDVTMLHDQEIQTVDDQENFSKSHVFIVQKHDGVPLYLAAESSSMQEKWVEEMNKLMIDNKQLLDSFLDRTKSNLMLPPCSIKEPDCFGYLVKLGTQWKSWSRRYCILKDACLYFYQDANAKNAFGVAYLHGYRVQQYLSGTKKYAFEIVPPDSNKKHYYFHTDSDADKKRWIAALEYSIDKWMKI
ncbi:uncharacterized protein LOC114327122 isoform X3 [Diabrotica virgifera virgifera]|uniref:Uncharacterized protein LOC114327122 isoform X3 n=1 Tax=Diabrotica virgifera virgifera TaxID=50390 RepID=A0A6P7F6P8_DIAVI|nr:uncharacterized protein LOC114327122 isoform X3 [Diabrotica virgifera virgifera]